MSTALQIIRYDVQFVTKVRRFWTILAHCQGQSWNASKISSSIDLDRRTVDRSLDVLEGAFMLRRLPPYSGNAKKRLVKSPKVHLRDSGLLHQLLSIESADDLRDTLHAGSSWEGFVIEQVLAHLPDVAQVCFYRTSGGAEIDLLIVRSGRRPIAVEVKRRSARRATKGLRAGMADTSSQKGFVVCAGDEQYLLSENIVALPAMAAPNVVAAAL